MGNFIADNDEKGTRCQKCNGCGLVRNYVATQCNNCNRAEGCPYCECGKIIVPYVECDMCYGDGIYFTDEVARDKHMEKYTMSKVVKN